MNFKTSFKPVIAVEEILVLVRLHVSCHGYFLSVAVLVYAAYMQYLRLMNLLNQDVKTGPFMDFEVKKDMRIAPLCRVPRLDSVNMAKHLDEHLTCQVMDELQLFSLFVVTRVVP